MDTIDNSHLYILIVFDNRYLFIPQNDVESIEIIADATLSDKDAGIIGWLFRRHLELPIFNLANDFSLSTTLPEKREYFILLKHDEQALGITCDEVENLNFEKEHINLQEIPPAMKTSYLPIRQLLTYQSNIAYIATGHDLIKYLLGLRQPLVDNINE